MRDVTRESPLFVFGGAAAPFSLAWGVLAPCARGGDCAKNWAWSTYERAPAQ
jgi:hypothetical protein